METWTNEALGKSILEESKCWYGDQYLYTLRCRSLLASICHDRKAYGYAQAMNVQILQGLRTLLI